MPGRRCGDCFERTFSPPPAGTGISGMTSSGTLAGLALTAGQGDLTAGPKHHCKVLGRGEVAVRGRQLETGAAILAEDWIVGNRGPWASRRQGDQF